VSTTHLGGLRDELREHHLVLFEQVVDVETRGLEQPSPRGIGLGQVRILRGRLGERDHVAHRVDLFVGHPHERIVVGLDFWREVLPVDLPRLVGGQRCDEQRGGEERQQQMEQQGLGQAHGQILRARPSASVLR
jgi:hypothetical protein